MACGGRSGVFCDLQEELLRRAELFVSPDNVLSAIAYSTCEADLYVVLGLLEDGPLREFLELRLSET
jgi:hypothetical protein